MKSYPPEVGVRTQAVLRTGVLPEGAVSELQRWGLLPRGLDTTPERFAQNEDAVVEHLQDALEERSVTELRETDLDIVREYLRGRQKGRLYASENGQDVYTEVYFCLTKLGEYAIPWQGEKIHDLMLDGRTHLRVPGNPTHIYFADVRDLFFGNQRALVVCRPAGAENGK